MPSDDELRRVAEDVRALARSLARDMRELMDTARHEGRASGEDLRAAGWAAREDLRNARRAIRDSQRANRRRHGHWSQPPTWGPPPPASQYHWGPPLPPPPPRPGRYATGGEEQPRGEGRPDEQTRPQPQGPWPMPPTYRAPPPPRVRPERAPKRVPPPLRHRRDGSTLLGLLVVVFGLAWLAAGTRLVRVPVEGVVAVALMVLGATMVVTARTDWALSRRRWPVFLGLGLVVALLLSSASPAVADGFRTMSFGRKDVTPTTWGEVPAVIHGNVGKTVIDLTNIASGTRPKSLRIEGGVGSLLVELPPDLRADLDVDLAAGTIMVNGGRVASGLGPSYQGHLGDSTDPALALRVSAGLGRVEIDDRPPAAQADNPDGSAVDGEVTTPPDATTPADPTSPDTATPDGNQ